MAQTAQIAQLVERPLSEREALGRGFESGPHHTKGVKMVLAAHLLTLA